MSELAKYEQASDAQAIRGLRAKYASVERQRQGLLVMIGDAEGNAERLKDLRAQLAQNLERRKHYVALLRKRGVKVDDPFCGKDGEK